MTSMWRILAAVDLARGSEDSVEHAVALATALSADLDLLYVTDDLASCHAEGTIWPASALVPGRDITVRRLVLQGSPAATIAARAEVIDADAIIMTSRRYGSWRRLWRRSVTEEVLNLTSRPVCVASSAAVDPEYRFRSRRILCVVTLDGGDTETIRQAQEIARRAPAELVLLHVVPETSEGLLHYAVEPSSRPLSRERAVTEMARVAARLSVPVTTSVMVGHAASCIALASREHRADLVLMSRARPQSRGVYGRSPADVLHRLHCPLLTVPRDPRPALRPVVVADTARPRRMTATAGRSTVRQGALRLFR